jgi:hypothetical protein
MLPSSVLLSPRALRRGPGGRRAVHPHSPEGVGGAAQRTCCPRSRRAQPRDTRIAWPAKPEASRGPSAGLCAPLKARAMPVLLAARHCLRFLVPSPRTAPGTPLPDLRHRCAPCAACAHHCPCPRPSLSLRATSHCELVSWAWPRACTAPGARLPGVRQNRHPGDPGGAHVPREHGEAGERGILPKPIVSSLIIPLAYCHINSF